MNHSDWVLLERRNEQYTRPAAEHEAEAEKEAKVQDLESSKLAKDEQKMEQSKKTTQK